MVERNVDQNGESNVGRQTDWNVSVRSQHEHKRCLIGVGGKVGRFVPICLNSFLLLNYGKFSTERVYVHLPIPVGIWC